MKRILCVFALLLVLGLVLPGVIAGGDKNMNVHCEEHGGDLGQGETGDSAPIDPEPVKKQDRPGVAQK